MKTEFEETMMLLWLKDVKKCQFAQFNWRSSTSNAELSNDSAIKNIISITQKYFNDNFNINASKSTQLNLLQQNEIDLLGLETTFGIVNNIYGVNINSYRMDVNKKTNTALLASIFEKMVNTAVLIHANFKITKAQVLFIAPHLSLTDEISSLMKNLDEIFYSLNLQFTFHFYTNEDYKNKVVGSVLTNHIDFKKLPQLSPQETNPDHNVKYNDGPPVKIGALVRDEFGKLVDKGLISEEIVKNLTDSTYSRKPL